MKLTVNHKCGHAFEYDFDLRNNEDKIRYQAMFDKGHEELCFRCRNNRVDREIESLSEHELRNIVKKVKQTLHFREALLQLRPKMFD